MQPAGDRLEVVDREHVRVEAPVPADDVERVVRVDVARPYRGTARPSVLHEDLDVLLVGGEGLGRAAQVAFAVRRVLQELPLARQVASRRPDVAGRLGHQRAQLALRYPSVGGRRGDDDVVAGSDRQAAEDGLYQGGAALDVHALVADRVAVQRGRLVGYRVGDPDVAVGQQVLATEHRVGGRGRAVELVRLEVPRLERMVGTTVEHRAVEDLAGHDGGRQVPVVEQRGVGGEALDAHQLLGVEPAVRSPELGVALARDLADLPVVGHRTLP